MLKLKELRQERGLTQAEMAKIFQISRQVYANYENQINEPCIDMLGKMSKYFDCTVDYILGLEDDAGMKPIRFTENEKSLGVGNYGTKLTDEEWEWIETLSELKRVKGDDAVAAVLTMVKTLIETKK